MGTSGHQLCYKRCQLVPSSDTCLVGYELTSDDGTSCHILVVRVDMGTSWHGYELTWVRVDIYCVVIDVNSYHHFILSLLGTSWNHLWYELTSLVVRVGICWWYELTWVRVDMGTSWLTPILGTKAGQIHEYVYRTHSTVQSINYSKLKKNLSLELSFFRQKIFFTLTYKSVIIRKH